MTYNGKSYVDVITVEDKSDPYVSELLSIGGFTVKNNQAVSAHMLSSVPTSRKWMRFSVQSVRQRLLIQLLEPFGIKSVTQLKRLLSRNIPVVPGGCHRKTVTDL